MNESPRDRLLRDMSGYMPACVQAAAAELDLGTVLLRNGNRLTAEETAQVCACDLRGCTRLLDALAALGYFVKQGEGPSARYGVADEYKPYLDAEHPASCIPILRHFACVQRVWVHLARAVRDGTPPPPEPSILGAEEDRVSFIMGMNSIAHGLVDSVMQSLEEAGVPVFLIPNPRILDVGGASGTYTAAFLDRIPGSTAALFDLPVGIAQARKRFAGTQAASRITLVEGDFTVDPLPSGFDFVWLSAIIHQMNREESRLLYAKIRNALKPGGSVAIRDFVMDESRTSPVAGALFGINMLLNTPTGMVYTYGEIREDLEQSGFVDVRRAVDTPTMCAVVTARKPE